MTIEQGFLEGDYALVCDDCGETSDGHDTFEACIKYAEENDWGRKLEDSGWKNFCPDCKGGKK